MLYRQLLAQPKRAGGVSQLVELATQRSEGCISCDASRKHGAQSSARLLEAGASSQSGRKAGKLTRMETGRARAVAQRALHAPLRQRALLAAWANNP